MNRVKVPLSYTVDEHTDKMIADLRVHFGVNSNAEVIRKALALAGIAAKQARADGQLRIGTLWVDIKG